MAVAGTTLALIASCVGYCVPIHSTVHNRVRPVEPDGQNWHQLDSSPDIAIHKSGLCVSRTPSHPMFGLCKYEILPLLYTIVSIPFCSFIQSHEQSFFCLFGTNLDTNVFRLLQRRVGDGVSIWDSLGITSDSAYHTKTSDLERIYLSTR